MHIRLCVCVCVHVHARVLESSEHSGSQLRSSQQPSVAQLNPLPPPHPPLLTVPEGLMCTAEGHVLGTRARRQAKAAAARLHFDHLCYSSLSYPSTMVWSGLMLPSSLSSTLSSLSVPLFSRSLATFSWVHRAKSTFEFDHIMEIEWEVFDGVTDWRGWFGLSLWSSAPCWPSLGLFSCWLPASISSPSSFSPSHCLPEGPATWSIWCVQTAPAPATPGAVGAEGDEMKVGS